MDIFDDLPALPVEVWVSIIQRLVYRDRQSFDAVASRLGGARAETGWNLVEVFDWALASKNNAIPLWVYNTLIRPGKIGAEYKRTARRWARRWLSKTYELGGGPAAEP